MGTFIIIVIIGIVIFFVVQLTDTSAAQVFSFNYKGYISDKTILPLSKGRSTIEIQQKFITITDAWTGTKKIRILKYVDYSNSILYSCMDGNRNQVEVIRSKSNLDSLGIAFFYSGMAFIYTNNPNIMNEFDENAF